MRVGLLPRLYLRHGLCLKPQNPRQNFSIPQSRRYPFLRQITCTKNLRQDDGARQQHAQTQVQLRPEQSESIKPESYQETKKARSDDAPKTNALLSEQTVSNKEQRKADWAIMKEMARYLWPKVRSIDMLGVGRVLTVIQDELGTRVRVGTALALLVGSKVRLRSMTIFTREYIRVSQVLNVQVPFYFKNIVDSMNVDFAALGGTAWTVGGAMIIACMEYQMCQRS